MASSRETLLQPRPVPTQRVDLPEFGEGEYVICHGMTAQEKNRHEAKAWKSDFSGLNPGAMVTQKLRQVAFCVRDDNGQRIFSDEDLSALGKWPASVFERVCDVCSELSGGAVDKDAAKNSLGTNDD